MERWAFYIARQCISMKDGVDTWSRRCASPLDMKG